MQMYSCEVLDILAFVLPSKFPRCTSYIHTFQNIRLVLYKAAKGLASFHSSKVETHTHTQNLASTMEVAHQVTSSPFVLAQWLLLLAVPLLLLLLHYGSRRSRTSRRRCSSSSDDDRSAKGQHLPSPPGLPIIGHLHLVGDLPHISQAWPQRPDAPPPWCRSHPHRVIPGGRRGDHAHS
jgi:hypothetical protein